MQASELSITVEDDRLNKGLPTNIPLLVPGQIDMGGLLFHKNPSRAQVGIAIDYTLSQKKKPRAFSTIESAVSAAEQRTNAKSLVYGR